MGDICDLRVLDGARSTFWLPEDPIISEVMDPGLRNCQSFDVMAGFFTGSVLAEMSHGLASYLVRTTSPLRMLVSPVIPDEDQRALAGGADPTAVAYRLVEAAMNDEQALSNMLANHTKHCLAYLLGKERLSIRVVLMLRGTYHPKQWTYRCGEDVAILSGSANATGQALAGGNVEQLRLDRNWRGVEQQEACERALSKFDDYWSNRNIGSAVSVDISRASAEGLLQGYGADSPPTEADYQAALRAEGLAQTNPLVVGEAFAIPHGLEFLSGPFRHQGEAVKAWEDSGERGVLSIATGGGKTICSLVAAHRLASRRHRLFILVSAPTRPLVQQWAQEMGEFGLEPYVQRGSRTSEQNVAEIERRLEEVAYDVVAVDSAVVTNELLNSPAMSALLRRRGNEVLLIGDEVHNLGRAQFIADPPPVRFRLGLSATPERQYDEEGTAALFDYFGGVVYEFGLDRAIGLCLVPYDYSVHDCYLSQREMDEYRKLSFEIREVFARLGGEDARDQPALQRKIIKRRGLLESASSKIEVLQALLAEESPARLSHTLIYTTDKNPGQMTAVNQLLRELGVSFHQLTQEETQSPALVKELLRRFRDGSIQVLTAKRVLDEGFNIPEITTAYVLASTTVERQWTQRRGRILRLCPEVGKTSASLVDLIALPPAGEPLDEDVRRMVRGELRRVDEFAELARNKTAADGPQAWLMDRAIEYRVLLRDGESDQ